MSYCINCGTALAEHHRFCFKCGTMRLDSPATPSGSSELKAPPSPSSPIVKARQEALLEKVAGQVSLVSFLCAAGAVFWAILLAQTAAVVASPTGRTGIDAMLAKSGFDTATRPVALAAYAAVLILICVVPIVLHAAAYYALTRRRRAGWVLAVLLAGAWSFVLVGIPFLYILTKREVRAAFGFV